MIFVPLIAAFDRCRVLPLSRRDIFEFGENRLELRTIYRLNVRFGLNRVFSQESTRPRRAPLKTASAVRAHIEENILYTLTAEGTFKRADHRFTAVVWQFATAMLTNWFDFKHIVRFDLFKSNGFKFLKRLWSLDPYRIAWLYFAAFKNDAHYSGFSDNFAVLAQSQNCLHQTRLN